MVQKLIFDMFGSAGAPTDSDGRMMTTSVPAATAPGVAFRGARRRPLHQPHRPHRNPPKSPPPCPRLCAPPGSSAKTASVTRARLEPTSPRALSLVNASCAAPVFLHQTTDRPRALSGRSIFDPGMPSPAPSFSTARPTTTLPTRDRSLSQPPRDFPRRRGDKRGVAQKLPQV